MRSKPESKPLRFSFDTAPKDRGKVTVTHENLDSVDLGERWKAFWSEWLDGVEAELGA